MRSSDVPQGQEVNSLEELADLVSRLYQTILQRPADPEGLAAAVDAIRSGSSYSQIVSGLIDSPEFATQIAPRLLDRYAPVALDAKRFFFLHVPKTAGTAFRVVLENTVNGPTVHQYPSRAPEPGRFDSGRSDVWPLWAGHIGVSNFPVSHTGITLFRETRSRLLSLWRMHERQGQILRGPSSLIEQLRGRATLLAQWFFWKPARTSSLGALATAKYLNSLSSHELRLGVVKGLRRFEAAAWTHDVSSVQKVLDWVAGGRADKLPRVNEAPPIAKDQLIRLSRSDVRDLDEAAKADETVIELAHEHGLVENLDCTTQDQLFRATAERLGFLLP